MVVGASGQKGEAAERWSIGGPGRRTLAVTDRQLTND